MLLMITNKKTEERQSMKGIKNNILNVKKVNIDIVRSAIREHKYGTKQEVAKLTGLSISTCGNILNDLVKAEEVLKGELQASEGGRPATIYHYNENYSYIMIFYLTVDHGLKLYTYCITDVYGTVIEEAEKKYEKINADMIANIINEMVDRYSNLKFAALSIPGIMRKDGYLWQCDEEALNGLNLEEELQEKCNLAILVEMEPKVKVLGYQEENVAYNENESLALITAPEGSCIGTGLIADGHILYGTNSMAGQTGFLLPKDSFKTREDYIGNLITSVLAIISVIDPVEIVMTGGLVQGNVEERVRTECAAYIPEEFMPKITCISDATKYLRRGLFELAIENMNDELRLIKK